jgi:predicted ArsR family transcriptional regulator
VKTERPAGVATAPPRSTRERVAALLLAEGPATAASLADRLGLSAAGIRRHLDAMTADGVLLASDPRPTPWRSRGRGRPARVYALSETGHDRAQHSYDDLAAEALAFLAARGGVDDFAAARADGLLARYAGVHNTDELASALTRDGYAATTHVVASGTQLCQHHCPVAHVAAQFPQLCEAETAAFGQLLGIHVQRLATIAHGDGVCTTHVPAGAGPAAVPTKTAAGRSSTRRTVRSTRRLDAATPRKATR